MINERAATWPGWETGRLIGRGSFGAVYEIHRQIRGRTEYAALKVLTIPQDESEIASLREENYDNESITRYYEDCLGKIENEYAMMADLKGHSNVVYCDDIHIQRHTDGFGWDVCIKMELLTPLKSSIAGGITEDRVISLGIDLCNALCLCEQRQIVHRDIKPENIFVGRDGACKLGDFGIARTMESTTGGTKTGTYEYMAPEVYSNRPYHTGADIYSLGLVLYWLLNEQTGPFLPLGGQKPTPSMKTAARERRFNGEPLPPPRHGSAALGQIVLRACAYEPRDRWPSAAALREALLALRMQTAPVVPAPAPRAQRVEAEDHTVYLFDERKAPAVQPEDATVGLFGGAPARKEAPPAPPKRPEAPTAVPAPAPAQAAVQTPAPARKKPILLALLPAALFLLAMLVPEYLVKSNVVAALLMAGVPGTIVFAGALLRQRQALLGLGASLLALFLVMVLFRVSMVVELGDSVHWYYRTFGREDRYFTDAGWFCNNVGLLATNWCIAMLFSELLGEDLGLIPGAACGMIFSFIYDSAYYGTAWPVDRWIVLCGYLLTIGAAVVVSKKRRAAAQPEGRKPRKPVYIGLVAALCVLSAIYLGIYMGFGGPQ